MRIPYTPPEVESLVAGTNASPTTQAHLRDYITANLADPFYEDRPGGAVALWIDAHIYAHIMETTCSSS